MWRNIYLWRIKDRTDLWPVQIEPSYKISSKGPTTHLPRECFRTCALHHKNLFRHHEHFPKIIITDRRLLLSLCTWLIFFGCLVYKLPPIVANDVKHVSPILYSFGIFSFALSIIIPNFFPICYSWHVNYWNHNKCFNWFG